MIIAQVNLVYAVAPVCNVYPDSTVLEHVGLYSAHKTLVESRILKLKVRELEN